ncbi:MAG TPA: Na+/H+ antiporter subunit D [Candidatus Salinicoccus merdavium]|nr:Na+/H+ antiporter subunit D [Candidatus Salinicoccus merdavium]
MMTDILPLLPVLIPVIAGIVMLFTGRRNVYLQRVIASVTGLILVILSIVTIIYIAGSGMAVTHVGNWNAPYGISLVIDMLAALLLFGTAMVTFTVVVFSFQSIGVARERYFYYPMVMFMITGVNGAFVTGDIFNMFVFFEVFLLASYVLITIGGTKIQLQEGFKYYLVNVISSNFFVLAVAYLYVSVGSLNMADIHQKLSAFEGDAAILTIIAAVMLFVFATKAGLFPFYFWLPGSYFAPPIPIMALFGALLTKVGVYAIARTYSLFFTDNIGFTHQMLLFLAVLTIVMGSIGALAYTDMKKIIIYNILIAIGVITAGYAMMDEAGTIGATYYLIHDIIIKAGLFFLIGFIIYRTGESDISRLGGLIKIHPVVGWTFFIAALGIAGVPPLSGFYGKLFITESLIDNGYVISAIIVLLSSLVVLYSVMRIFISVFWGESMDFSKLKPISYDKLLFSSFVMIALVVILGFGADIFYPVFESAAQSLYDPASYSGYLLEVE